MRYKKGYKTFYEQLKSSPEQIKQFKQDFTILNVHQMCDKYRIQYPQYRELAERLSLTRSSKHRKSSIWEEVFPRNVNHCLLDFRYMIKAWESGYGR